MDPVQAVILGIVQGLTEFFPVSSSGHLVLFQHFFNLREPALSFDISVHVGTLLAVAVYFFSDIAALLKSVLRFGGQMLKPKAERPFGWTDDPDLKTLGLILAGTLPTAALGLGFHQISDHLFTSLWVVGLSLFFTAALLVGTRLVKPGELGMVEFTVFGALIVGLAQGVAVIPGVSRSGATIAVCLCLGLKRDTAARFSFLLAIPAILGALVLSLACGADGWGEISTLSIALGTAASAGVGYIALSTLIKIVRHGQFFYFAPYCVLVGIIALMLGF
ncbi:MAG: undecaprenyl-diphosphate phosphatase [Desulfobacterales bacterium]|nr:undecaprenyl-diphosphate phosphatase [Desulfobacterales bacterium]